MTLIVFSPSEAARRLLQLLIQRIGFSAQIAQDADEALELVAKTPTAALMVDAREGSEETGLLLGLSRRRYPKLPCLTLRPGRLEVSLGDGEQVLALSDGSVFPSERDLERSVPLLFSEQMLRTLKPSAGRA